MPATKCPECCGVRLHVYRTRRPGKDGETLFRYRECSACGCRTVTRYTVKVTERLTRVTRPGKKLR